MKKFGIKILLFSLPAILFVLISFILFYFSQLNTNSKLKEISKSECLLMGDSQIQRLNGDYLDYKTENTASSGEHFYFTYNKLLKIVSEKDYTVNKVILGVSVHSFSPVYNRLFNLNFSEGKNSLKRYLFFIPFFDNSSFFKLEKVPVAKFISGIFTGPDWGGFKESEYSNPSTKTVTKTFNMHFSIKKNEEKFSSSQKKYLHKIDSLCYTNNIQLFIVSTPYHNKYKDQVKKEYYDLFYKNIKDLHKNTYHLNFLLDKVDSNLMSDANHLNKKGAEIYSKKINQFLAKVK